MAQGAGAPGPHAPRAAPAARREVPPPSLRFAPSGGVDGGPVRSAPHHRKHGIAPARLPGRFHASTTPYWRVP